MAGLRLPTGEQQFYEKAIRKARRKKKIYKYGIMAGTVICAIFAALFLLPTILTITNSFMSKSEMEEQIISLLGGRVAEALVLGDISTGASNDIERASKIARAMVTKYGMSEKLGAITFGSGHEEVFLGRDFTTQKNFSEVTSGLIDEEVKRIIDTAYRRTEEILNQNMDNLHTVANVLLEKEKIDGEEFNNIMNS